MAAPSKAWNCGRLLAWIAGSNPAGGMDVTVADKSSATGRSLIHGSATECERVSV